MILFFSDLLYDISIGKLNYFLDMDSPSWAWRRFYKVHIVSAECDESTQMGCVLCLFQVRIIEGIAAG